MSDSKEKTAASCSSNDTETFQPSSQEICPSSTSTSSNNTSSDELHRNPYAAPLSEDNLRDAMQYRDYFEDDAEFQESLTLWPVCPSCGKRRLTQCPICKNVGNLFPLGDADYWVDETQLCGQAQSPQQPTTSCASASCSCGGHSAENSSAPHTEASSAPLPSSDLFAQYLPQNPADVQASSDQSEQRDNDDHSVSAPLAVSAPDAVESSASNEPNQGSLYSGLAYMKKNDPFMGDILSTVNVSVAPDSKPSLPLPERDSLESQEGKLRLVTCYVCSESFQPKFPPRCEWCGHEFDDADSDTSLTDLSASPLQKADNADPLVLKIPDADEDDGSFSKIVQISLLLLLAGLAALGYLWFVFR